MASYTPTVVGSPRSKLAHVFKAPGAAHEPVPAHVPGLAHMLLSPRPVTVIGGSRSTLSPRKAPEAQARIEHNKQRDRLKAIMQTMGSSKGELMTADLKLSAKLAKIELPEDFLLGTPYAKKYTAEWDSSNNSPRAIKWRPFIDAIEYPKMQSKDQWKNDYEAREAKKAAAKAAADKAAAEAAAVAAAAAAPAASAARNLPYVSDDELRKAHNVIKSKLATQFGELRQSFRALDTDGSGFITHEEAIASVTTLNLGLPKRILARFVDLADYDGDGEISFAEFARVLTADDIMLMKDSVGASYKGGMADSHKKGASIPKASRVIKDGVTEDDIRMFVLQMKEKLLNKYTRLDTAFKNIDEDRSGFLNANEFKFLLKVLNLERQKPAVIDVLLGLMDDDGDGQINHQEFTALLSADDPIRMGPLASKVQPIPKREF